MWTFPKWGLVVDAGGAYLLPRLVGMARAKAMVMLGETVAGIDAVDLGLAYRCVADAEALASSADELVARLAAGPTRSLGLSKRLLNATFERDLADSLELEGHFQALATSSPDLVEGHGCVQGEAGRTVRRPMTDASARQRVAAYVVCTDAEDRLLLCRLTALTARPGAWTLPGGGVEFGEHPEDHRVARAARGNRARRPARRAAVRRLGGRARPGRGRHAVRTAPDPPRLPSRGRTRSAAGRDRRNQRSRAMVHEGRGRRARSRRGRYSSERSSPGS